MRNGLFATKVTKDTPSWSSCASWLVLVIAVLIAAAPLRAAGPASAVADAAEKGDRARVRTLLTQRADVNAPQADGMTALHWAAQRDDAELVDLLIRSGGAVQATTRYGVTPLTIACTNGNGALVARLLDAGADPNLALPGGETPLMTAARSGSLAAVKALLAKGAAADGKDDVRGQSALMWAAAEGHADVVQTLISAGADVNRRLPSGFTPLLFAVREGRLNVVRVLLEAGVDVNGAIPADGPRRRAYGGPLPRAGLSPLLLAVSNAHYSLASELLDAGANPSADVPGYTALHAIAVVRNPGVGDNDPPPDGSGTMTSLALVKKLVARGANVNAKMTKKANLNNTRLNELGATPFMLAALTADVELMKTLVALGADASIKNVENSTALMVAAGLATRSPGEDAGTESEVIEAVKYLLSLGADVDAVDANGETAMHAAAYKNLPGVVKLLAASGAKIQVWNRPDKFGWTPLAIAAGYRHGNFKPSPVTETAIREVMIASGVTPPENLDARMVQIYTNRSRLIVTLWVW
jgi:uncharacterized protein